MNHYTMKEQLEIAKQASEEVTLFLESLPSTRWVKNVEMDKSFQKIDVDLLWCYEKNGKEIVRKVEVKGDRYFDSPNFFFEVISNMNKMTPGCFMYSEAHYFFYYFPKTKELNILPLKKVREWFIEREEEFKEIFLKTNANPSKILYQTKGRIVPKARVRKEVTGVKTLNLTPYLLKKAG